MRATTIHAARDIRFGEVPDPVIKKPTDAIIKVTAGCVCGSDLWPYRGESPIRAGNTIGHECIGVVEEIGAEVRDFKAGDYVIVPFCHCDNTCANCQAGAQSACVNGGMTISGQGEYARVNQADGSLVATGGTPPADLLASLLALSDVMPTGWHAAVAAGVKPGDSVVVVGDGAVWAAQAPGGDVARRDPIFRPGFQIPYIHGQLTYDAALRHPCRSRRATSRSSAARARPRSWRAASRTCRPRSSTGKCPGCAR